MRNVVLAGVLIVALIVGVGSVIFYNVQEYNYSLELKDNVATSDIYVTLSSNGVWNGLNYSVNESARNIQSVSTVLGKMKFENRGVLSRIVEVPRLVACADLTSTSLNTGNSGAPYSILLWPVYTTYEPVFADASSGISGFGQAVPQQDYGSGIVTEIYPQSSYGYGSNYGYSQQPIEVKAGDDLIYYISLRNTYVTAQGRTSNIFKNGKIEVYELPTKNYNPISDGVTFEALVYNPTCDVLAREFNPVKTIEII